MCGVNRDLEVTKPPFNEGKQIGVKPKFKGLATYKATQGDGIGIRGSRLGRRKTFVIPVERSAANTNQTFDLGDRQRFHAVIIYQDISAGRRAKHLYDWVIQELAGAYNPSLELWSFQVLALPEIGNLAAQAAAQADFVILSMRGKAPLSVQTRDWIERWSGRIYEYKPALVALFDQPKRWHRPAASTVPYLRSVADSAGINFLYSHFFCRSTN